MASDTSIMTFLAFPPEIRDLIYLHFNTTGKTYSLTAANVAIVTEAPEPNLGLINTCKTVQYEMLEMLKKSNTFRFLFPCSDTNPQFLYHELGALTTHVEFYIDFSSFPWRSFRYGHLDPAAGKISEQVCKALRTWNSHPIKRESCRIIIKDNAHFFSPLLQLQFLEVLKTLVGLETLLVIVLKWKSDLWKLAPLLSPSLGPSWIHHRWPVVPDADRDYGCVRFHPRKFLSEKKEQTDGKVISGLETKDNDYKTERS